MKKFIGMALAAVISASSFTALAAGAIPDHQGTSMDGIEIGTAQLNSAVKSYYDLFEQTQTCLRQYVCRNRREEI